MTVSIGDTVKVVKDNYEGDDLNSLSTYKVNIGDYGEVLSIEDEYTLMEENIIVEFNFLDGKSITLCLAEDEVEKV